MLWCHPYWEALGYKLLPSKTLWSVERAAAPLHISVMWLVINNDTFSEKFPGEKIRFQELS